MMPPTGTTLIRVGAAAVARYRMKLSPLFPLSLSLSLSLPNEYGMHDGEHEEWDAGCNAEAAIECPLSNLANNIFAGLKYG